MRCFKMNSFCHICGNEFSDSSFYKPRSYCSDNCRNYFKYKNALERCLINLNPTIEAKKIIRGDMFRLCNSLSNGTIVPEAKQ